MMGEIAALFVLQEFSQRFLDLFALLCFNQTKWSGYGSRRTFCGGVAAFLMGRSLLLVAHYFIDAGSEFLECVALFNQFEDCSQKGFRKVHFIHVLASFRKT